MSSPLKQNTTTIQELLNTINSLPEAGGVELPELSNPATAEEVFLNKEFIDEDGNSVTGTFSIDNELSNQDNLISQIQTALQNKATATGEDVTSETIAYTTKLATLETAITALETELQGKASGGSGGGSVETCTGTVKSAGIPNTNSVWFLNSDMRPDYCTPGSKTATTFTAIKGSFVFIYGSTSTGRTLNGVTLLYSNGYSIVVSIDSDNFSIVT